MHGHIDDLCRFHQRRHYCNYIETNTEHYIPLQDNLKFTERWKTVPIIVVFANAKTPRL
jgi:hypothetical protein